MPSRLPAPIERVGLSIFGRLPPSIRRRVVHVGTSNFTVGAVLSLRDDEGRILLVRQRHTRGWSLPGGLLRHGETPEVAVLRETSEELGLRLDPAAVAPAVPHALVDPGSRRVDIVFESTGCAGPQPDGVEILEARYFAPDALPRCTQGTLRILRRCGIVPAG